MIVGKAEVLSARFNTRSEADVVRATLETMGYEPQEVSYVADALLCSSTFDEVGSHWAQMGRRGVLGGGAIGAIAGIATSIGSVAFWGRSEHSSVREQAESSAFSWERA